MLSAKERLYVRYRWCAEPVLAITDWTNRRAVAQAIERAHDRLTAIGFQLLMYERYELDSPPTLVPAAAIDTAMHILIYLESLAARIGREDEIKVIEAACRRLADINPR